VRNNTTGNYNSIFGYTAGYQNSTGLFNSFFGLAAGVDATGSENSFFGANAGGETTTGRENVFIGGSTSFSSAGSQNTTGSDNTFVGRGAGTSNISGNSNTALGNGADVEAEDLDHATAIGAGARVSTSNTIALGRFGGADKVVVYGLGAAGSTALCRNASNQISTCSSSLRYKTDVQTFTGGLNIINRLRPITFNWINGGTPDLGFGAEEVAKVEPLLTYRNDQGEIEGVKYSQISVVLVNAIKEQQSQISQQQTQVKSQQERLKAYEQQATQQQQRLRQQQSEIDSLKNLLCSRYAKAAVCKSRRTGK
jgi:hypothetical protein